jgi:hypothetical protein
MRKFIRHPSDIPMHYSLGDIVANKREYLKNISKGGLCFTSRESLEKGMIIKIEIPIHEPVFSATGVVVWCKKNGDYYDVGVKFTDVDSDKSLRMVEQVCYIEHYKMEVLAKEGRRLSGTQAALEWIQKFAQNFPKY